MATIDKLIMMANQIAANLAQEDDPAAATANHIRLFWDPRMRARIAEHLDAGGEGLSDCARRALASLG